MPTRHQRAPDDTTACVVTYVIRDKYGNPINMIADDDQRNHREACVTIAASRVKNGVWTTRLMESTPGHRAFETVFDASGRLLQSRERGPDVDTAGISVFGKSEWIVQDHRYDFLGRKKWQSIPRIDGDAIAELKGSTFAFDNAGRPTKSVTPWGTTTRTYDHDAVTSTEPGPSGITTISTKVQVDPIGRAIEVTDAKQSVTHHVYGPFNELRRVELPDGTARETKRDSYGRGVFDNDPDRGKTVVDFNGFDEVVKLHDAAGRHYAFERDTLGRTIQRSEGLNVSTYEFDTAPNGIGLPARTTGADGHVEVFAYDTSKRLRTPTGTCRGNTLQKVAALRRRSNTRARAIACGVNAGDSSRPLPNASRGRDSSRPYATCTKMSNARSSSTWRS